MNMESKKIEVTCTGSSMKISDRTKKEDTHIGSSIRDRDKIEKGITCSRFNMNRRDRTGERSIA